ncbi:MAG: hypothetical protein MUP67_05020, partial [Acidimicrobiia bacterium]|nr:hypothetical protein [Acidimicrobiia bacterium]
MFAFSDLRIHGRSRIVVVLAVTIAGLIGVAPVGAADKLGKVTEFAVETQDREFFRITPASITAGPDGNLWFTVSNGYEIGRITPKGEVTAVSTGRLDEVALGNITAGPDGNLWFTAQIGTSAEIVDVVGRITPAGVITEFSAGISPLAGPFGITVGCDGNLWFTEGLGNR